MSPAPWHVIQAQLIANGDMTEQAVTRTPKARHCRECGRAVTAAITDAGFEIAVEPTPTTPAGELHVLTNGGHTYALLAHGEMVRRTSHRIRHRDANRESTHAQHQCGIDPPETNPQYKKARKRTTNYDGPPPF